MRELTAVPALLDNASLPWIIRFLSYIS